MTGATVLLASAGRRPYLVRWFSEAFGLLGIDGRVVLADLDVHAPARAYAAEFILAPPVASADYPRWLRHTLHSENVDLAISVNDFELSTWSKLGNDAGFDVLMRLAPALQDAVEDKRSMATLLAGHGIATPETLELDTAGASPDRELILKGRYGSGSRGLRIARGADVARLLPGVLAEVTRRDGTSAADIMDPADVVVAQQMIRGNEFGLDVVSDLNGEFACVLVRQKLSMRSGETDRAITVESADFESLARRLAQAIPHRGVMDVDVIVDEQGGPWVIDVNPRFGGGYPFSHVAGANVPAALIGWMNGSLRTAEFLGYQAGVAASKSVEIVRLP